MAGMARLCRRWVVLLFYGCIALQAFLCWNCGRAQAPGFLSINCGSTNNYMDAGTGIEWISDTGLMTEGELIPVAGMLAPYLSTMRLFTGNQSKYCYSLSNSAVTQGAFFLVRASFWKGTTPPYTPTTSDGHFRFKLLIDADEWWDLDFPSNTTHWFSYEIYTLALRSSIDVCLARSSAVGDPPFISALELRPLPSSLSATRSMNNISRSFIYTSHSDSGVAITGPSWTRYPLDSLDRFWVSDYTTEPVINTTSSINTTTDPDMVPVNVLQTSFGGKSRALTHTFSNKDLGGVYYSAIHFAEIDPAVNASGQRMFNITVNEETTALNDKPIDVFAEVGANAAYEFLAGPISPTPLGQIFFKFIAIESSEFPPFYAAIEIFQASNNTFSAGSYPSDVSAIEDLKTSMNLKSYSGDPCLPNGFGYSWLTCMLDPTPNGGPRILSISLSNYSTGGEIPKTINTLTMLNQILLNGNNLVGSIPVMSALASLETLKLDNNKLIGEIPPALLERKQASTLDFEFSGNPFCQNSSRVACTLPPSSSKSKSHTRLIIGVIIPILLVVIIGILGLTIFYPWKNKNQSTSKHSPQQDIPNRGPVIDRPLPVLSLQEFTFKEIKIATNDFSTQIGMGGFGPVYKGTLKDGRIVAIKVASNSSHQGSKEFLNEVDLLSRIHHKNLVGLVGYCNEGKLVLVYDFMSNGSLFDCLHGPFTKASPLPWRTRLQILVDAAQGFDYLHYGCNPQIIHRDIKSSNILLNDELEAKISDFGISRNSVVGSGVATTTLMGSMGYFDPEYLSTMRLTEKIDVYSFGVVLFEVVSGKRAVFINASQEQTHIVEWVKPYIDCGIIDDIVDATLHKRYDASSVWKILEVALACVQSSSDQRPTMSDVYSELKEAQRIEFESDKGDVFDNPSIPNEYNSLSFGHVHAR